MTCPLNLFSSEIEAVRPGKASFHYYFPRLGFFSLQRLYSIFLLAFLCKIVLLDCLEKTVHIFEPSRENYYFSKSKGNSESMLTNNKDDKGGKRQEIQNQGQFPLFLDCSKHLMVIKSFSYIIHFILKLQPFK